MKKKTQNPEKLNRLSSGMLEIAARILLYTLLLLVLYRGVTAAYGFGYGLFSAESLEEPPGRDIRVTIPQDADTKDAAELLLKKGLIDNTAAFRVQAVFFGLTVKPGTYTLNTSESIKDLLEDLNAGQDSADAGPSGTPAAAGAAGRSSA